MRVISGSARSVPLDAPRGLVTRPTSDKIKETLFNILQFEIGDALFIDLFAGSGGIGIEALSRGASGCIFVDNSHAAVNVIHKNLARCHLEDKAVVYGCDAMRVDFYMPREIPPDKRLMIFMDPPYGKGLEIPIFNGLMRGGHIKDDTLIVLEESKKYDVSRIMDIGFLSVTRIKEYKNQKHIFIKIS